MSSVDIGCIRAPLVDAVVSAFGVGVGVGSLLPGICISPPEAKVAQEIRSVAAKRKHRSLFIVLGPFGVEVLVMTVRKIVEPKNHNINRNEGWRWS